MRGSRNIAGELREIACATSFLSELLIFELGFDGEEIYWTMMFIEIPHCIIDMLVTLVIEVLRLNDFSYIRQRFFGNQNRTEQGLFGI